MSGTIDRHRSDIEKKIHLLENRLQDVRCLASRQLNTRNLVYPLLRIIHRSRRSITTPNETCRTDESIMSKGRCL